MTQQNAAEGDSTFETITLQLAMAFGQGAGNLLATPGAATAAIGPFRDRFSNHVNRWDDWALTAITFARTLGQVAATRAIMKEAVVIDEAHVLWALERVQSNHVRPLGPCSCLAA